MEMKDLLKIAPWLLPTQKKIDEYKNRIIFKKPLLDLTPDNFELETQNRSSPIVVGFFSSRCRYCKRTLPGFEQLAQLTEGQLRFGGVDNPAFGEELGRPFNVTNVPAFVAWVHGASGPTTTKYFGPRTSDDVQMWICMQLGVPCSHLPMWKRSLWAVVHTAIGSLAHAMRRLGIKVTDHGSGGGPLPDGGTLGFAGLIIGIGCVTALAFALVLWCCLCRQRRTRGTSSEREKKSQ